jgi:SAM-dependent methyltransferase
MESLLRMNVIQKILRQVSPSVIQLVDSKPVNFNQKDTSFEGLQNDVEYAARIAKNYLLYLKNSRAQIEGKIILEVGPGINFGTALILACYGAKVMVSDRFLTPWDKDYHPKFYAQLKDWLSKNMTDADTSLLTKILSTDGYPRDVIQLYSTPLEELEGISDKSVDVIFSNAVLEHIESPQACFKQMARVSRSGALGFHQVDFRDHRNMDRPLEFLLMNEAEFANEFKNRHGECGNRWRHWEYIDLFEKSGFNVVDFEPNIMAEDGYLDGFLPRLQASSSKHKVVKREQLRIVSGLFNLRRNQS